jgi:hypothetical protein
MQELLDLADRLKSLASEFEQGNFQAGMKRLLEAAAEFERAWSAGESGEGD